MKTNPLPKRRRDAAELPPEGLLPPTALVLTGGAVRSAFGAGVVKALADLGLSDFSVAQAVSGGAPNLAYFAAGQHDELWSIWSGHIGTERFVDYRSLLRRPRAQAEAPLLNTHYLVDEVIAETVPLDTGRLASSSIRCRFLAARLEAGGLALASFGNDHPDLRAALKACMALPSGAPSPIGVADVRYVDGSLIDPIPFRWQDRPLADRTLVVLNAPWKRNAAPVARALEPLLFKGVFRRHPAIESAAQRRWSVDQQTRRSLRAAERRGEVLVVAPRRPTPASAISRSSRRIRQTLEQGYREVMHRRAEIEDFLGRLVDERVECRAGRRGLSWARGPRTPPAFS